MATGPKIRYDIEANTSGADQVDRLARELEKLDDAISPALAERARLAADALRQIGQQQTAIDVFVELKRSTQAAEAELQRAQNTAQEFARELAQTETPTRAQAGQMEKLRDAVRAAKVEVQAQTASLDAARAGLQQLGIPLDGIAARQRELRQTTSQLQEELATLSQTAADATGYGSLVKQVDAARARMEQAAQAATAYARSLGQAGPPSREQAAELQRLETVAAAARSEFERLQTETVNQAASLRQAGVATEQLAANARNLATAERAAASAATNVGQASAAASTTAVQANDRVRESVDRIGAQLRTIQTLAATAIGGGLAAGTLGQLAQTADLYANIAARVRLAAGSEQDFQTALQGVFEIATRTNSSLESTAGLYTRIAQAGKTLRISNAEALALTETINQATQLSGGSAASADAALQQLMQAFQSGVLRGEEFNSVMEQAPRLAQALADGLGLTTAKLREQAEAGALTAQTVIRALQGQASAIGGEFAKLPPTVGRALQNLSTEWTRYVGEVDKANGISATAASAIQGLAGHLDTLGAVLYSAGKAAAAYAALRLAQSFIASAQAAASSAAATAQDTAARVANTAATAANTTATAANTAAKTANAAAVGAAAESAAVGVGRLAGLLSAVRTFTFLGLITNLQEIGTWLGESTAKLMGYGKAIQDAERDAKALEAAQRAMAAQDAALAQQRQQAIDKTLGLTDASRKLIAEYDGVIKQGGTVADALEKVSKAASVSDITGINNLSTALDALRQRGVITATQVAESLAQAIRTEDLQRFETQARASFDASEQGARRLAAALAAIDIEALRRAGTSALELQSGFNSAATSAINDLDQLVAAIDRLGIKTADTGRAIAGSLDKATEAASTERAVQEVIARFQQLGAQGQITGLQLAEGLEKARAKLDELKPGVNSLDEALKNFGLKSRAELKRTADTMSQSWQQIRNDTTVSLQDKIRAFEQYRDAAIAANNGIVPSGLAVEEEILRIRAAALNASDGISSLSDRGRADMSQLTAAAREAGNAMSRIGSTGDTNSITGTTREERLAGQNAVDATGVFALRDKLNAGTLTLQDEALINAVAEQAKQNAIITAGAPAGAVSLEGLRSMEETANIARRAQELLASLKASSASSNSPKNATTPSSPTNTIGRTVNVNLNIGGRSIPLQAPNQQAADDLVKALEAAQSTSAR